MQEYQREWEKQQEADTNVANPCQPNDKSFQYPTILNRGTLVAWPCLTTLLAPLRIKG